MKISSIAFGPSGEVYIWAYTGWGSHPSHGVYRSTDGGSTWVQVLSKPPFGTGSISVSSDGYVFVGYSGATTDDDRGVVLSTDMGETWTDLNEGLVNRFVKDIVTNSNGYVFAGTYQSVFRSASTVAGTENEAGGNIPTGYFLAQNFPNPFNPVTTIRYSLPTGSEVSLKVFNPLGEEVATLVTGRQDAGPHTVSWDAAGQPSGLYFYRLQAGDFTQTKKLVLLR
jgi:hypothetical protein